MTRHGMVNTRLYNSWRGMKQRCLNPKNKEYHNYGERGISICNEWMDFNAFKSWALSNGYSSNLTIERKDSNNGYTPENCCWASLKEQMNNKRNNIIVNTEQGPMTLSEYCNISGVRYGTAQMQYYRGKTAFLTRPEAEAALNDARKPGGEQE